MLFRYPEKQYMKKLWLLFPVLFAFIFVYLFKGQQAGINVLLFNLLLLGGLYGSGRFMTNNRLHLMLASGALLSAIMVVIYGSSMAMAGNVFSLIILSGAIADPHLTLLVNGFAVAVYSAVSAPFHYLSALFINNTTGLNGRRLARFILIFIAPLLILFLFALLYANASPFFNNFTGGFVQWFSKLLEFVYKLISPASFWIFIAGLAIAASFLYGKSNRLLVMFPEGTGMNLNRTRKRFYGRFMALKTEFRSGVVLLILLNVLIAIMNVLDIFNVWLFFEWNGDYLKQFVHEGTWLLIISIAISIIIVLYYFRGNLNHYPRRKLLLNLALLWMAQNALLAISVGIRNMWYIQHFNLAFKRIGVYAFLLLVLFGIATVMFKISRRKSQEYLFFYNGIAAYVLLIGLGLFNWDKVIARHNIRHANTAFFHTNFMVTLNGSALPEMYRTLPLADEIIKIQREEFEFDSYYMSIDEYYLRVKQRVDKFKAGYPELSWQGWNLADYQTFKSLQKESKGMKINPDYSVIEDKADTSFLQSKRK